MIIKSVKIENYMCYYDSNTFNFSDGLNIVLGENGEGKTKLIEAIEWLLNGGSRNLEQLISAKKLSEIDTGERLKVSVSIEVEQFGDTKLLSRSFIAQKRNIGATQVTENRFEGIEENSKGERSRVDGDLLIKQIFPSEIRKYSIFKGESELDIFNNEDALINLINLFSDAKHYDKYSTTGEFLFKKADDAVSKSYSSDKKNQQKNKILESQISSTNRRINGFEKDLSDFDEEIDKTEGLIENAKKYVDNATALEVVNTRISKLEEDERREISVVKDEYTTYLFDRSWILKDFETIFNQFQAKIQNYGFEKRIIQSEFDKEIGRKQGALSAVSELLSDTIPLPFNVPDKSTMQELIKEEFCKVCGRPAKEGSKAYKYMVDRLNEYIEKQEPIDEIEEVLFIKDYISELTNLANQNNDNLKGLRSVEKTIKEQLEFNNKRKSEVELIRVKIEKEKDEINKIIGSSSIGKDKLGDVLDNYNNWQGDITKINKNKGHLLADLNLEKQNLSKYTVEKKNIDLKSANSFLIKSRDIVKDLESIFKDTKEYKFDQFIKILQDKSNEFFVSINKGAFTGRIEFAKRNISSSKIRLSVDLYEGDNKFHNPNQSLLTSMHISILFAISKLAEGSHDESYPLIFDAPTSSFGETKTGEFLNIISSTKKQIILLTKDFIGTDANSNLFIKPEFDKVKRSKAMWVKLERPFDSKKLSTINSKVMQL